MPKSSENGMHSINLTVDEELWGRLQENRKREKGEIPSMASSMRELLNTALNVHENWVGREALFDDDEKSVVKSILHCRSMEKILLGYNGKERNEQILAKVAELEENERKEQEAKKEATRKRVEAAKATMRRRIEEEIRAEKANP